MAVQPARRGADDSAARARRAHELIPGGAHTYSKDDEHFPPNAPAFIVSGNGSKVIDDRGREWLDWGMGLRSVILGHGYRPVVDAARGAMENGTNYTRPSFYELDLAEKLVELIPCAEMVKFGKNGSDATTAAVRAARAYTGRWRVLACDGSFHASDDWWLSTQPLSAGAYPQGTLIFPYNDLGTLEAGLRLGDIAAVIMEPMAFEWPYKGYLEGVRGLCTKYGAVLIFDEIITGFRFSIHGAQHYFGVTPDLATFGKALGNGFSVSALVGQRDLMSTPGVHLLSSTHGGETHGLAAALATIAALVARDVRGRLWDIGELLSVGLRRLGLTVKGASCSPNIVFASDKRWPLRDYSGGPAARPRPAHEQSVWSDGLDRLEFAEGMAARSILLPYLAPSLAHSEIDVAVTIAAAENALAQ